MPSMRVRCGGLLILACAIVLVNCAPASGGTGPQPHSASTTNPSSAEQQSTSDGTQALLPQQVEPVQTRTLEELPPISPRVRYENGQLTIESENATLRDILETVGMLTGAGLEMPSDVATERVATHLGPGPTAEVISALLYGSKLGLILVGATDDQLGVQRILITKTSSPSPGAKKDTVVAALPKPVERTSVPVIASPARIDAVNVTNTPRPPPVPSGENMPIMPINNALAGRNLDRFNLIDQEITPEKRKAVVRELRSQLDQSLSEAELSPEEVQQIMKEWEAIRPTLEPKATGNSEQRTSGASKH
jgi:hypothetical protein